MQRPRDIIMPIYYGDYNGILHALVHEEEFETSSLEACFRNRIE